MAKNMRAPPKSVLDCESRESTLLSLSACFNCSVAELQSFCANRDAIDYFEQHFDELPSFKDWYLEKATQHFGKPDLPTELCWFHGTRVPAGTTFSEGLLPLGPQVPRLIESLLATLDNEGDKAEVRRAFERRGGYGFHFREKLNNPIHWGPYAFLVKEVASCAKSLGQHDYLGMPEIIEDLCDEIEKFSGIDLLPHFVDRWHPAIVKFRSPADSALYAIGVALCYLNSCATEGRPGGNSVWCFDGRGLLVPSADVLGVEWLSQS